jgi:hypothetical protein
MFSSRSLTFHAGELVPHSGVYAVLHGKPHESYHEVFIAGGNFPQCEVCTLHVTFTLIRPIPYISKDEGFKPDTSTLKKTA